mmetsp:Transcript_21159/g.41513  ORF Transcript_21159/g.41513 Transcript_21159/m.41513 type:complete len:89 (-) Transcript_21159:423-689(-)
MSHEESSPHFTERCAVSLNASRHPNLSIRAYYEETPCKRPAADDNLDGSALLVKFKDANLRTWCQGDRIQQFKLLQQPGVVDIMKNKV